MGTPKILDYFAYEHLPERLRGVSKPFAMLAHALWEHTEDQTHPELHMALRKLLEAKDCAVRAAL